MCHPSILNTLSKPILNFLTLTPLLVLSGIFLFINKSISFCRIININYTTSHSLFMVFKLPLRKQELTLPIVIVFIIFLNIIELTKSFNRVLESDGLVMHAN